MTTRHDPPDSAWDAALLELDGHVLQSSSWLRVQRALGHEVAWASGAGWLWAGAIRAGWLPRYLYVPHGPAARTRTDAALRDVAVSAARRRLDFARLEPTGDDARSALTTAGARATRPVQPRHTWILDIDREPDELRRQLESGHRSRINAAERRGIVISATSDPARIDVFLDVQRRARERSEWSGQPAAYLRTVAAVLMPRGVASLYVASAGGIAVAAAVCFDFGGTRYYAHSAIDPERGRRLGAGPPLLWRMILDARERGATQFDFWGVVPVDDERHPWNGFSRFKKAFGGRLVERVGTWDVPVRQARYGLYEALRRAR